MHKFLICFLFTSLCLSVILAIAKDRPHKVRSELVVVSNGLEIYDEKGKMIFIDLKELTALDREKKPDSYYYDPKKYKFTPKKLDLDNLDWSDIPWGQ